MNAFRACQVTVPADVTASQKSGAIHFLTTDNTKISISLSTRLLYNLRDNIDRALADKTKSNPDPKNRQDR